MNHFGKQLAIGVGAALGLAASSAAVAELVAYDPFLIGSDRTLGEYSLNTSFGAMGPAALGFAPGAGFTVDGLGQAWAVSTANFQANSIGEDSAAVNYEQGGRAQFLGGTSLFNRQATRQLKSGLPASNEWWVSIMLNRLAWDATKDSYFVAGFTDGAGEGPMVGYSDTAGASEPELVLRFNSQNTVLGPSASSENVMILMQVLIDTSGDDTINYWIDPDTLNPAPAADGSVMGAFSDSLTPFTQFRAVSPGQSGIAYFDEIRLGTSFESVTEIPEPTSLALLSLGGLALLRRRSQA